MVTLEWLLGWVIRRVKEELAGTEDEVFAEGVGPASHRVEVKSDLEFAREIKRKAVNYA